MAQAEDRSQDLSAGVEIPTLEFGPITTEDLVRWAGASGDYNPIHYDQEFALSQGLPNVIMHGPFKLALACRMLMDWAGTAGFIHRIGVRYSAMDVPGNILTFKARITGISEEEDTRVVNLEVWSTNQAEKTVLKGDAVVHFPVSV